MFPIRFMLFEIIDKRLELFISHQKMSITIGRTGMYKIEIEFLSFIRYREIPISPCPLREIISFVGDRIFTKDHASYEGFRSCGIVGVGIVFFEKGFEMIIVMVCKFHEHKHIRISFGNRLLDSVILFVVFVDICKQDSQCAGRGLRIRRFSTIEMIELPTQNKEKHTEYQKRYASEITTGLMRISGLHLFSELYETYENKKQ